ncbi:MAG: hypothetical protein ACM3O8_15695 [Methylococcaceae bacterium]
MKLTLLTLVLLFITSILHAQEPQQRRPGHFGLSFAGIALVQDEWDVSNYRYYDGGTYDNGYYHEKLFYTIGFNYLKPVSAWLDMETGLEYSIKLGEEKYVSFGDTWSEKANTTMVSVPLTLRANFLRFFFVNAGLLTDFDLGGLEPTSYESERYQSGMGYVAGLGVKYGFKYGGQIYINPYFKRRAIIEFWENEDRLRMNEAGIRLGFYFNTKGKTE